MMVILYILLFVIGSIIIGTLNRKKIEKILDSHNPEKVTAGKHQFKILDDGTLEIFGGTCVIGNTVYAEERMADKEFALEHEMCHIELYHGYLKSIISATLKVSIWLSVGFIAYGAFTGNLAIPLILSGLGFIVSVILRDYSNLNFELAADARMQSCYQKEMLENLKQLGDHSVTLKRIAALEPA